MSVTGQLSIAGLRPGGPSVKCPKCDKKTFRVTTSDAFGECFHPACRYKIYGNSRTQYLSRPLEMIVERCHKALGTSKTKSAAWTFLLETRKLHEQTVLDAEVGIVPATGLGADLQTVLQEETAAVAEKLKNRGLNRKEKTDLTELLKQLHDDSAALMKLFGDNSGVVGWLVFPQSNEHGTICGLKLRCVEEKLFAHFTTKRSCAFGTRQLLFNPLPLPELLICEGELTALSIRSLMARCGSPATAVVAFGGAAASRPDILFRMCRKPTIWCDNDDAGTGSANTLRHFGSIYVCESPTEGEDAEDYINGFNGKWQEALAGFKNIIQSRELQNRDFRGLVEQISRVRVTEGPNDKKAFQVNRQVAEIIQQEMCDRGRFLRASGQTPYYFDESLRRLVPLGDIEHPHRFLISLLFNCGLNQVEATTRYVIAHLASYATKEGSDVTLHRVTYYDRDTNTCYWSIDDSEMLRITAKGWDRVSNGTDGVLFLPSRNKQEPFNYVNPDDRPENIIDQTMFSFLRLSGVEAERKQSKVLSMIWMLSLFFPQLLKVRPILVFVGAKGSAKTGFFQALGHVFYGYPYEVKKTPSDEEEVETLLTNSTFVVLDNLDTARPWLEDLLAVASTGGEIPKRVLYTTNDLGHYKLDCFVGITSRTPKFRRDDVADRIIPVLVDRLGQHGWESPAQINMLFSKHLNNVRSALIDMLMRTLGCLADKPADDVRSPIRMADFGCFALRVASIFPEETVSASLANLGTRQVNFSTDGDPTVEAMCCFLDEACEGGKPTPWLSASAICAQLAVTSIERQLDFSWKDRGRAFSMYLPTLNSSVSHLYTVEIRKNPRNNVAEYQYARKVSGS